MTPALRVAGCSTAAAQYAVLHWHYSRSLPYGPLVKFGVWESEAFVGVVIYSRGASAQIGDPFGLRQTEVCELTRVALRRHATPVSRIVAISLRLLKRNSPGQRLVVSFADMAQGHHGGIYQAGGWLYVGLSQEGGGPLIVHGRQQHARAVATRYGRNDVAFIRAHVDPQARRVPLGRKHKYLMPLDAAMRAQLEPLRQPYPNRGAVTYARA